MRHLVCGTLSLTSLLLYVTVLLVVFDPKVFFPMAAVASQLPTALVAGYLSIADPHPYVVMALLLVSIVCTWVAAAMFTNEEEHSFCHPLYWTPEGDSPGPHLQIHSHLACQHVVKTVVCLIWFNSAVQVVYVMTSALWDVFSEVRQNKSRIVWYPRATILGVLLLGLNLLANATTLRRWYVPMLDVALLLPAAYLVGKMMGGESHVVIRLLVLIVVLSSPNSQCMRPVDNVLVQTNSVCDLVHHITWLLRMAMCIFLVL